MSNDLLAVLLGLAAAACWGTGDFSGGLASRRANVYAVVLVSELLGVGLLVGLALLLAEALPPAGTLAYGAAAGIFGTIGLIALYRGFATGQMGMVAPVAAVVTAVVPVIAAGFIEGPPSIVQLGGFVLALAGVWLVSQGEDGAGVKARDLGLPVVAGLGFGLFLIFIDRFAALGPQSLLWPLVVSRTASLLMLLVVVAVMRQRPYPPRAQLPVVAVASVMDTAGNALYALAARAGRLDVAAVLSSLYPAATVLLAWVILHERLTGRRWLGVAATLAAVVLIAS